jgi:hypothetical protein
MDFIKNIFRKKSIKLPKGAFFGATAYELSNMLCGIGKSRINNDSIYITDYPFKPSFVYPDRIISASSINAVCLTSYPLLLKIESELVFISRDQQPDLEDFVKRNQISIFEHTNNWSWLLEPYLDTEYTDENHKKIIDQLSKNGITESEINTIRAEVQEQMYKYNFDTMLWDWGGLGLPDVLAAMRVKYNEEKFKDFYERAMKIELKK